MRYHLPGYILIVMSLSRIGLDYGKIASIDADNKDKNDKEG